MKILQDDRFYSVHVEVHFIGQLDETLTYRNIVKDLLVNASKKYPSKQQIRIALDNMYGATLSVFSTTLGKLHTICFSGNVLCDKYTLNEEQNVQNYLDFLKELIYQPLPFEKNLAEIKRKYRNKLERMKEDVATYSIQEIFLTATTNTNLTISPYGDIQKIEEATVADIQNTYQNMIENDVVQVYVAGNVQNVTFKESQKCDVQPSYVIDNQHFHETIVQRNSDQSFINILLNLNTFDIDDYSIIVANEVLGGMDGLLFRNVREKNGLCYLIYSQLFYYDRLILIHVGVSKSQIQRCIENIHQQIEILKAGLFSSQQLENAKSTLRQSLLSANDSLQRKVSVAFHNTLKNNNATIQEKLAKLDCITKEDVCQAVAKLEKMYMYVVEGELYDKGE